MQAVEEEVAKLRAQVSNTAEELRAVQSDHATEVALYRATINDLRDEIARMTTLAEGRGRTLLQAIEQRDDALARLRQIDAIINQKGKSC